ncbi:MAG TPA: universal stress protein [Solirubrobacteraceae bacterium]|nr:universal stress protein [Solirubrobacteraceae bacterium]
MSVRPVTSPTTNARPTSLELVAVGVDGRAEGRDAAALAATIGRAIGAELLLVGVHPDPLIALPADLGWKATHKHAEASLREVRDALAPGARISVKTDWSIPRALDRVVRREHRNLLVLGSSRHAQMGRVRIGGCTRQLLGNARCALAVAPRGFAERPERRVGVIGVGYDGGPEAREALRVAGALAAAAGASLRLRAVVDDRLPAAGWVGRGVTQRMWDEVVSSKVVSLREEAEQNASGIDAGLEIEALRGSPPELLLELAAEVDLLVIGSRRWGVRARVLLGATGEALMHDASCPVMVIPRSGAAG